ncbi:MAG: amidohydrolase family protein [Chthoniobacterales bacterium]
MPPLSPTSQTIALQGRIVTMDAPGTVLSDGVVYIKGNAIIAVLPSAAPAPPDFDRANTIRTGGSIFPGLIELHNHLSYNALPLWKVPKKFANRNQWSGPATPDYHKLVTGPMSVLGRLPEYVNAIVRFVECRCLLGGVTTSQGIALSSNAGIMRHYRGLVRNVESPGDLNVRAASTHIPDIAAKEAEKFMARLKNASCLLLHLSEGTDRSAREHFLALHLANDQWAIAPSLVGIHSVALLPEDFAVMQSHGASMVWSPLSNLLLYGETADIAAAQASGIKIGLGSDWAPSGSKNLLGELKVASLVSAAKGDVFTARQLVAMATVDAARILKWETVLGSIEQGKRADLLVINGVQHDPYDHLIAALETDISLVLIDGLRRYGTIELMKGMGSPQEEWKVGGEARIIALAEDSADMDVGALTLRQASDKLSDGLQRLPELAKMFERPSPQFMKSILEPTGAKWSLVLDHDEPAGAASRPHLPYKGHLTAMPLLSPRQAAAMAAVRPPLSQELQSEKLERLTVADDTTFLDRLREQVNLPDYVKDGLPNLFGV